MRRQTLVTPPVSLPVSVSEAKTQSRIYTDDDDALVERLIYVATAHVEQYLQRKLISQTWKMFLDVWPISITTLFGDLQSVTHIKYTDDDEIQYTFDSSYYLVDTDSIPGRIILKADEIWPTDTLSPKNPIEIQFITGYGDSSGDIPQDIRHAVVMLFSYLYTYREDVITNNKVNIDKLPFSISTLLYPYRVPEWIL